MRGQCLIHLADIVGTNLELNQAWALGDTCWPCAERTVALGITLMVDTERTQVGTVQWLGRNLAEAVVAQVDVGDVWHVITQEVVRESCQLVEAEVHHLQEISILTLDGTLRDAGHLVAAQIEGDDWRTGSNQL